MAEAVAAPAAPVLAAAESSPQPPSTTTAGDANATEPKRDADTDAEMANGTGERPGHDASPSPPSGPPRSERSDLTLSPRSRAGADASEEDKLPEGATEVLYVHNLNERIKLDSTCRYSAPSPSLVLSVDSVIVFGGVAKS